MSTGLAEGLLVVPLAQTIRMTFRESAAAWRYSRRVLNEYVAYLRILFPIAGDSDAFLVGLRRIVRQRWDWREALSKIALEFTCPPPRALALDFGEDGPRSARNAARSGSPTLSLLSTENGGMQVQGYKTDCPPTDTGSCAATRSRGHRRAACIQRLCSRIHDTQVTQEFECDNPKFSTTFLKPLSFDFDNVQALHSDSKFTDFVPR